MIRRLCQRLGPVKTTCLVTAISIVSSELVYFCLAALLGRVVPVGFFLSGVVPAAVTPPISFLFLRVVVQLDNAEKSLNQAYQELKTVQAQLVQSGKLASLGELASGIAHELNQPLMVVRMNSQLIKREFEKYEPEDSSQRELIYDIEKSTKRMMNIINHLRIFSRQSTGVRCPVELNRVIEECFLIIGEQLRVNNIELKTALDSALPQIEGDANQLEQVFLNLISNAMHSIKDRMMHERAQKSDQRNTMGIIKIQTRTYLDNDKWIEALVIDNGLGIDTGIREKIFDPFFTTKKVGMGTGLGLSISYGIIKNHGGEIKLLHTGSEGTTMQVRLPILEQEADGSSGVHAAI